MGGYLSVVRKGHSKLRSLRSRPGFCAAHHVIVEASETGHAAHQIVQQVLENELAAENILLRLPSFVVAILVVSRTDCVAMIMGNLARFFADPPGLATFDPPIPSPPIEMTQYWPEKCHRDPGHRWLRSAYFEMFAKYRR